MPNYLRCAMGGGIVILVAVVPFVFYRWEYTHYKRLREVVPGRVYRSGQLTGDGFAEAVERFHFHTIVNLQDDFPDPLIPAGYFGGEETPESEMCRKLGVRYVFIPPDTIDRRKIPACRPEAIEKFLAVMDDPASYPVLVHCRAGLHRTGVMIAVYRMEYQGWSPQAAIREMKAIGFGEWPCTSANDYVAQYVLAYHPGIRNPAAETLAHQPDASHGTEFILEKGGGTPLVGAGQDRNHEITGPVPFFRQD